MVKEIENFRDYLAQIISMDKETFDIAIKYFEAEHFARNEYFVHEGQSCNRIAYISKGLFRIYYLKEGNEINTCFCKENSITSSFNSFINHIPSTETIQALEDSVVVTLSSENLGKLFRESDIWQTISRLLTEKECLRLSERAGLLSFETALEKYKNLLKNQPELIQRVPIQYIASYIGVSRETLSRIRAKIR